MKDGTAIYGGSEAIRSLCFWTCHFTEVASLGAKPEKSMSIRIGKSDNREGEGYPGSTVREGDSTSGENQRAGSYSQLTERNKKLTKEYKERRSLMGKILSELGSDTGSFAHEAFLEGALDRLPHTLEVFSPMPGWRTVLLYESPKFEIYQSWGKAGSPIPRHNHKQAEYFLILEGTLHMSFDDKTVVLVPNSGQYVSPCKYHSLLPVEDVNILTVVIPPLMKEKCQ